MERLRELTDTELHAVSGGAAAAAATSIGNTVGAIASGATTGMSILIVPPNVAIFFNPGAAAFAGLP
jgi:lactobin A/cerein 7B family class IIb bacteriocin